MLPPITRIASVSAATVAMRSSGHMIVVMILAGTSIPPMPSPATKRRPQRVLRLSTRAQARDPHPAVWKELAFKPYVLRRVILVLTHHEDGGSNHKFPIMPTEDREEPQDDHCASENAEADW